jgi:hypothetical protein
MRLRYLPFLVVGAACQAGVSHRELVPGPIVVADARPGDVLTAAEIQQRSYRNAWEAIARLRPGILAQRGPSGIQQPDGEQRPAVYLDRIHLGGVETLHSIPAGSVAEIRYLSATAAMHQLGVFHPAGVITITPFRTR